MTHAQAVNPGQRREQAAELDGAQVRARAQRAPLEMAAGPEEGDATRPSAGAPGEAEARVAAHPLDHLESQEVLHRR